MVTQYMVQFLLLQGLCEFCIDVNKSQFPCCTIMKLRTMLHKCLKVLHLKTDVSDLTFSSIVPIKFLTLFAVHHRWVIPLKFYAYLWKYKNIKTQCSYLCIHIVKFVYRWN